MTRVALVTGAAGGIGSAVCRRMKAEGFHVVGVDIRPCDGVDESLEVDLSDSSALTSAYAGIDRVDSVVNNAAVMHTGPLTEMPRSRWDETIDINVSAAFDSLRLLHRQLAEASGSVVNVSSVHAVTTTAGAVAYATSKAALVGLTRAAALELGPSGIRVNAVLPGATDTPMLHAGAPSAEDLERVTQRTPLRRIASPDEIAEAILFLADGSRSGFITGQSVVVDGGATLQLGTE